MTNRRKEMQGEREAGAGEREREGGKKREEMVVYVLALALQKVEPQAGASLLPLCWGVKPNGSRS